MKSDLQNIKFDAQTGLMPAIVQDDLSGKVLMLGYMNAEALRLTQATGKVTFYSRSKQRLWVKGETSGHFLLLTRRISAIDTPCADCDLRHFSMV